MATVKDILNAAYAKSKQNMPGVIASESTELRSLVDRSLRGLFAVAARVNPVHFGARQTVALAADGTGSAGWAFPADMESLFRLVAAGGQDVAVVPYDDQAADIGLPSVYQMGRSFYPIALPAGFDPAPVPIGSTLTFYYSRMPAATTALTSNVDPDWPGAFDELLALEVGIYLALKDGRSEELGPLKEERDRWARLFVAHLEHLVPIERRRWGHVRRFNTNTLVPTSQLLAGGSAVAA